MKVWANFRETGFKELGLRELRKGFGPLWPKNFLGGEKNIGLPKRFLIGRFSTEGRRPGFTGGLGRI